MNVVCNICGEEADNSEDLAKHMEKMHAIEESGKPEQVETPDEPEDQELENPAPIPTRI
jgi:hypothetical protein